MNTAPAVVIAAFGTTARVCKTAVDVMKKDGIEVGLFRPISLYPFPKLEIRALTKRRSLKQFLVVEMSTGQMLEDVELAVLGKKPVTFYGRQGGIVPSPEEVIVQIKKLLKKK